MADTPAKEGDAEKAYADATSEVKTDKAESAQPAEKEATASPAPAAKKAAPRKKAAAAKSATAKSSTAAAPKKTTKTATKAAPRKKAATAKSASARKPAPASRKPAAGSAKPTVTELKEKIMATKKTDDVAEKMTETMSEAVGEMQARAQQSYEKTTAMVSEMTELAKGNMEAMVESGKILTAGMQDMGKTYADEAKTAYETATSDMKEMAAVKSPTELFQLQGKIMRRNFDMMVQNTSKNTEAMMKLMNDAMAPVSSRVNVTVESMSKVAA